MYLIPFYKDANGNWQLSDCTEIAGTLRRRIFADGKIFILTLDGATVVSADSYANFGYLNTSSVLVAYESLEVFKTATKDFFVKASEQAFYAAQAEATYSYGILLDNQLSAPTVTRIGNLELHKSLPVHSNMKGCLLLDDGTVNYYLNPTDWTKKADGAASKLDGTDGQVMVEIPAYYRLFRTIDSMKFEVRVSDTAIAGFEYVAKRYISAYEASIQRSTGKLASVINTATDYRGGNNTAGYDGTAKTLLGKPATQMSLAQFRTAARARNAANTRWNCNTYEIHKSIYWLFVIEYANLNSQAAVVGKSTITGYMDGGLGIGVTDANGANWGTFNSNNPFVPCGASNSLGNASGEVSYLVTDFGGTGVNYTAKVPRYRGIENPFGHLWKWTDGILIDVKTDASGGTSALYTTANPDYFSSVSFSSYISKGNISRVDGYIKMMLLGAYGDMLPAVSVGASATTFFCDYFYKDVTDNALRGVFFGGNAGDGSYAGLACAISHGAPSNANTNIGSRLCFI